MPRERTRRDFVETVVVSAAAGGLAGCSGDPATPTPDRKPADPPEAAAVDAAPTGPFPQGVASGDPRPSSVVLWTRYAPASEADRPVGLRVAADPAFESPVVDETVTARADHDGCLRVKVVDLDPDATYHYRFVGDEGSSPAGRTATAPAPDADRRVAVGVVSCQDYAGRYYNAYLPLLARDDLDAVVHLGDYVYETTGGPGGGPAGEQPAGEDAPAARSVTFRDPEAAIAPGDDGDGTELAARSLSNYRDLYRTYRSDPVLRRLHAAVPVVHLWDDHEFSNDAWGAHATYTDGRADEASPQRRRNAERAFFEYAPVDPGDAAAGPMGASAGYPDTRLYRDLRLGRHLHLLLTDYRTFRPDHLLPEDAFPGRVAMTREDVVDAIAAGVRSDGRFAAATAVATLAGGAVTAADLSALPAALAEAGARLAYGQVAGSLRPYVDLATRDRHREALRAALTDAYREAGVDGADARRRAADAASGRVDVVVANRYLDDAGAFGGDLAPIDAEGLPRGVSYELFGKRSLFGSMGSRYVVAKPTFDLYATYRRLVVGETPAVLGAAQRRWLLGDGDERGGGEGGERGGGDGPTDVGRADDAGTTDDLPDDAGPTGDPGGALGRAADATWAALCSSTSLTPMVLDLADPPPSAAETVARLPEQLRAALYLNADQWDGFPAAKRRLLSAVANRPGDGGAAVLSGDIHAAFATDHGPVGGGTPVAEFTGPAVSSPTLQSLVAARVASSPDLAAVEGVGELVGRLDRFLEDGADGVRMARSHANGALVVEAGPDALAATYYLLPPDAVGERLYDRPGAVADRLAVRRFRFDGDRLHETTRRDG